jgi:hypothetical protein
MYMHQRDIVALKLTNACHICLRLPIVMLFRTAGVQPAHDHDAGWKPAVRKSMTLKYVT